MIYGVDKWLAPITLTSSNNKFRLNETTGGGEVIVTLTAGTYYLHASENSTYPGLYKEISDAIAAQGTANDAYTFTAVSPTLSYQQVGAGVRLSSAGETFTIDWDDSDFTMDPRWFGFESSDSSTSTVAPDATEFIDSKWTVYGQWMSYNEYGGEATRKSSRKVRNSKRSHDRPADAYVVTWNRDDNRRIIYEQVPAAHIFEDRAKGDVTSSLYASVGRLAPGDTHNAFETVWNDGLRKLEPVLIIHGDGDERVDLGNNWEAVRLIDDKRMMDYLNVVDMTRSGGEYYTIDTGDLFLESSSFGH
jgi:hypothetical protein